MNRTLSIWNELRPYSVGFDNIFDHFSNTLEFTHSQNQSYPPYNINKVDDLNWQIEMALAGFNLGKAAEITRDELKFTKFIQRLRKRFTGVFGDILKSQLILKGIITIEDWQRIHSHIQYDYLKDGNFAELKEAEIMRERLSLAQEVSPYVGKYYSVDYIRKKVLRQSDEDIIEIDNQIADEIKQGIIASPEGQDMDGNDDNTNINNIGDE